jgi:hypothetical protein
MKFSTIRRASTSDHKRRSAACEAAAHKARERTFGSKHRWGTVEPPRQLDVAHAARSTCCGNIGGITLSTAESASRLHVWMDAIGRRGSGARHCILPARLRFWGKRHFN